MSFLPNISPGNVRQRLPSSFVYDNDLRWERPTEWLDLGIISAYGTDTVPEKVKGLAAVYPNDEAPAHNYVAFHFDTTDDSTILVDWGDGNPAETTHESNFRSDVDGYTGDSHGSVSRVASHNGQNDVLLYQSGSSGRDGIKNVNAHITPGNAYTLTFDYYADASFSGVWGVQYSYANVISIASNFPTIVTGAWTSVSLTIPATRPAGAYTTLRIRPQADANSVYANTATGDQIGFRNIKVVANNSGSGYYYKENVDNHHVYDYDAITSNTTTAKTTPFRGYRQAIFEVTLTGSAKFSQINFDVDGPFTTHTNYLYRRGSSILDIFVSTSEATNIAISDNRPLTICEQIELRNTSSNRLTGPANIYNGAKCLQSIPFVPWVYNAGARSYLYAFAYCQSLKFLPDDFASDDKYWFKNATTFKQAFDGCVSLQYIPEGAFGSSEQASCVEFYLMFRDCRSLRYIPYLGVRTGSGTDTRLDYVFTNCYELQKIPEGFSIQRANSNDIDRLFYACRSVTDWSSIFDGTTDVIGNMNLSSGIHIEQTFSSWTNIEEFPFVGQFTKCDNAENAFSGCTKIKRFNSQYDHLDFSNITMLETCFNACSNLEELPEIKVRSLTANNALFSTFYACRKLRKIKFTGMIAGPGNGEYYRLFYTNYSLTTIDGIDFSFATETSDYYQTFHLCKDINAIRFPGTFRAGYASPRINVTVNGHAALSGEYQINANGLGYSQVGGDGILSASSSTINADGDLGYQWTFIDGSDGSPSHSTTTYEANMQNTPWAATWPANTLTFSEVMTGFKYTVSGNSGDGLRYSPIKRTQMLEIFNQLHTVSYSATLDVRNNTYTADLTAADKAIATDKGWTLSVSY